MSDYRSLTIRDICFELASCERAMIISHIKPDGDTIGSAFALKGIIEAAGGEAVCKCAAETPKRLQFLYNGQDRILYSEGDEEDCDLILSIDVASPTQLDSLASLIGKIDMMIDHHGKGEAFADNYIDPNASSAGEIVYRIYKEMISLGIIEESAEICRGIYAAASSDTGSFKHTNTAPSTHLMAAELLETINGAGGMTTADISTALFGTRTKGELTAQMIALNNLTYAGEGDVGIVMITADERQAAGITDDDIGSVVDIPRSVEGVMVGVSIKQSSDDRSLFFISSRANCDTDLSEICAEHFGGGGHKRAAGGRLAAASPEEAMAKVAAAFADNYKKYLVGDKDE